jgi:hypothetical protein
MVVFNKAVRDGIFLTGYDVGESFLSKKQIQIPKAMDVAKNFTAGVAHNYFIEGFLDGIMRKVQPDMMKEGKFVGKVAGLTAALMLSEKFLFKSGKSSIGGAIMKSLVSAGAESMI